MAPEQPLTVDELMALPDDTPIVVMWSGGNGPHRYTLVRDPEGRPYAAPSDDVNGRLRYYNPIRFVGQEEPRTRVWADDFTVCQDCEGSGKCQCEANPCTAECETCEGSGQVVPSGRSERGHSGRSQA